MKVSFVVGVFSLSVSAWGCLGSPEPPIERLLQTSDLVIKARVISVSSENTPSAWDAPRRSAEVAVERLYKGQPASSTVQLHWKNLQMCHGVELRPSSYVLLFLNQEGNGYTFKDLQWGRIASDPVQAERSNRSAEPADLLDADLRAELRQDSGDELLIAVRLFAALYAAKLSPPPICTSGVPCDDRRRWMRTASDDELVTLLSTNDDMLKAAVHRALLAIGDYRFLKGAAGVAEHAGSGRNYIMPADALLYARAQVAEGFSRVVDERSVPLLNRLSSSESGLLRRAVVEALRQNRSPSSVPYLIARLDDTDPELLAQATWGLFEIAKPAESSEGWVFLPRLPRTPEEDQHAAEVVGRWKDWWSSPAAARYKGAASPKGQ